MGTRARCSAVCCALVAFALAAPASADPVAEARRHFEQAEAYFLAGAYDRAIDEYQAAYDAAPHPAIFFNIGLSFEHLGDAARAIEHYERYLKEEPSGAKAAEARARREALARKLEQTAAGAARAAEAEALRRRAAEHTEAGALDEALAALERARELSSDPEIRFALAEVHRRRGEVVLALAEFRRYLATSETGPNRAEAARRIDELEVARAHAGPAPDRRDPASAGGGRRTLLPAAVAGAVTVGFTTTAVIYGGRARSALSELDSFTPPLDSNDPRIDEGKPLARNANIALALAGVSLAACAGLTAWALWPRSEARSPAGATLAPYASPGGAGAMLEVTW
jgi:tetratricopeptide (TPR) repeat protein